MVNRRRLYFGKAYSYKIYRGGKSIDVALDTPAADQLAQALLKYTNQAFQAIQSGIDLEYVKPVEITLFDGAKTNKEGKFLLTVTQKPSS